MGGIHPSMGGGLQWTLHLQPNLEGIGDFSRSSRIVTRDDPADEDVLLALLDPLTAITPFEVEGPKSPITSVTAAFASALAHSPIPRLLRSR